MTQIGILSDTHIEQATPEFLDNIKKAFQQCEIIVHAGDLTDVNILECFAGKEVHAVAGNCCNFRTSKALGESKTFIIDGYLFALWHGASAPRDGIEEQMFERFPEADCLIYGHTHRAVCHQIASTLYINPGSFIGTGRYGAPGSYAIVTTSATGLEATIHHL